MSETHTGNAGELSAAIADAVAEAAAWTVRVDARRRYGATGIVWSEGVVVTANHIVERDEDITVTSSDGTERAAIVAGRDPGSDIAVLRVDGLGGAASQADAARVGMLVLALGRAGRGDIEASLGIVSAIGPSRRSRRRRARLEETIRPDVTMYPGFSGGPLIDVHGALLGMNTSAFRGGATTLPNATLAPIVEQLLAHRRLKRGYLGLTSQPVALPEALAGQAGQESGLLVVAVESESPAASAGLMVGDILLGIDGDSIRDTDDLRSALDSERAGTPASLRIARGGDIQEVSATIGER